MSTNQYQVTGMSYGHCENAVRAEVSQIPGVTGIKVNAATGRLAVTVDGQVDDAAIVAAVGEAGYAAVQV